MRMRCDSKILLRATLGALAITALAAFVAPAPAADTVLFLDTFTYPTPGTTPAPPDPGYVTDINAQIDYSLRQSGSLVASGGPITYTQANHADQGGGMNLGYSGAQNGSSEVIQSAIGACFTPNMNFNNEKSAGGLIVSFDAANWDPWGGNGANLAIVSIGLNAAPTDADPRNLCTWATPHFSFEFGYGNWFGGSAYGMFNSGSAISGGALNTPVQDNYLHHVELVCTDTSGHDNNPFDGVGNTHIEISVDYVPIGSYTKGSGGYANNYITLGGYEYLNNAQEWDNLTVIQTEVPIFPLNQWAGAAVGGWSDGSKWSSGIAAGGQGDVARFMALSSADTTVNVTAPVTVGTIQFDNTHAYAIQSSNPSVNTITLDNLSGTTNAAILVDGGSHVISTPLVQTGALDIRLSLDASLTVAGSVTGNQNDWNIYGPGIFNLTGTASSLNSVNIPYTGSSSDILNVSGGSLSAFSLNVGERGHVTISDGGSVITSYSTDVNHLLTVTGAGSSLTTSILSAFRPALYDDAPKVEVTSGGTLTAESIVIDSAGVGGSWVVLSAGGTIDTSWIGGDGAFNFNGGALINSTGGGAKTTFDVLALVFTNGSSYSLDTGEFLTVSELLGRYDAAENASDGTFTFNGGTLKCRHDPRGLPNYLGAAGQLLTHVYVNASSTVDLAGETLDVYQPLEGNGNLHFTGGTVNFHGDNSSWGGNLEIDPYVVVGVVGNNPNGLGLNGVNIPYYSNLGFIYATESMTVSNPITLNGPGNSVNPLSVALAWDPYGAPEGQPGYTLTLTGTLTVHNEEIGGAASDVAAYAGSTLELNGLITDGTGSAIGGLTFGNGANGDYFGGACRISGSDSNTYRGDTSIRSGLVFLNKDSGKTAIPSNHIYIGSGSGHTGHAGLVVEGVDSVSSQLDPAVVITFNQDNNTEEVKTGWVEFAMNGHSQTVGGLDSPETQRTGPLNAISNTCTLAAAMGFADYPRPTTTGTLTIKTVNAGDDYTYSGRIFNGFEGDLPLSIVKDGPGTQRFVPGIDATDGVYSYTGGTTVKAGKLDVGAVGKFTPNAPVSVEGGELALGDAYDQVFSSVALKTGMLTGSKTVASTSDFDMQAGLATVGLAGDVGLVKTTAGTVTLAGPLTYSGNTEVQAGTLEIAGDATLTTVTGADVGTLKVCDGSSLTATSIQVGTLVIGGTPTYTAPPAPAAVPEPSTFVLLVLASLAFAWFWRRKL